MSQVTFLPVLAFVFLCVGCESQQDSDLDANKNLVRRFVELSNAAEWDRLAEIVALGFGERWVDAVVTVRHVIADGDEVVVVWEFQARSGSPGSSGEDESAMKA